jgi:hypothetical protein
LSVAHRKPVEHRGGAVRVWHVQVSGRVPGGEDARQAGTLRGQPILSAECHCDSCRRAADAYEALPGAPRERSTTGGVLYVLWCKDRVERIEGEEFMTGDRLKPGSKTRRVVTCCCNAPMFPEFSAGHWLSLNAARFPDGQCPAMEFRAVTADRGAAPPLPDDIPNLSGHNGRFMLRLPGARAAMGFRNPPVAGNVVEVDHA